MPRAIDEVQRLKDRYGDPRLTAKRIWMGVPKYEAMKGTMEGDSRPSDTEEMKDIKWASPKEAEATFRERVMSSGSGGLKYRAYQADVVLKELQRLGYL